MIETIYIGVAILSVLLSALWIVLYLGAPIRIRQVKRLKDDHPPMPPSWPKLSVIVPACNEESTIEHALVSLRAQTYPNLEILLVEDRSTDGTAAIVDRIAASDPRMRPLHLTELPKGWLGKVHALHRGVLASSGELVLFTDADIVFEPGVLEKTVALFMADQLDHLAILPDLMPRGFVLEAVQASFGVSLFTAGNVQHVGKPDKDAFVGVGAFNLVRREAYDKTEGLEWLKMEPSDDFALGLLFKKHNARAAFRLGLDELSVRWYNTTWEMIRGLEKNTFGPTAAYSNAYLAVVVVISLALGAGPFVAISTGVWWMQAIGVAALISVPLGIGGIYRHLKVRFWPSLFAPFGSIILLFAVVRAAYLCSRQGGVYWRGTLYPVDELARGRRIDMTTGRVREAIHR